MFTSPRETFDQLATLGTAYLERLIAIDSQSDERSPASPSTEGQLILVRDLQGLLQSLGIDAEVDGMGNLVALLPARGASVAQVPVALMVHIDTARGTAAVPSLCRAPEWDGGRVNYPANSRLEVSVERYPVTRCFLGDDVLHGPGERPVGLDDKLGAAELLSLATVLVQNPELPHGPLVLVFRPDEEIGRMAAVEELADRLKALGVRYGYTIDGLLPFEINVSNFNAAHGLIRVPRGPALGELPRSVTVRLDGAKSHGATAKAEGYLNATTLVVRALERLSPGAGAPHPGIVPVAFETDTTSETSAVVRFAVSGRAAEDALLAALGAEVAPHAWRGAGVEVLEVGGPTPVFDAVGRALAVISWHHRNSPVQPVLSEDSDGTQGYSNAYAVRPQAGSGDGVEVAFRLRDFDPALLASRKAHVAAAAAAAGLTAELHEQYIDMGPALAPFPELVEWARLAAAADGVTPDILPIRGGTGVDPFLERGIPVANLGTGYFAPESEKELTSCQNIARHTRWLVNLVQVAGRPAF